MTNYIVLLTPRNYAYARKGQDWWFFPNQLEYFLFAAFYSDFEIITAADRVV